MSDSSTVLIVYLITPPGVPEASPLIATVVSYLAAFYGQVQTGTQRKLTIMRAGVQYAHVVDAELDLGVRSTEGTKQILLDLQGYLKSLAKKRPGLGFELLLKENSEAAP